MAEEDPFIEVIQFRLSVSRLFFFLNYITHNYIHTNDDTGNVRYMSNLLFVVIILLLYFIYLIL